MTEAGHPACIGEADGGRAVAVRRERRSMVKQSEGSNGALHLVVGVGVSSSGSEGLEQLIGLLSADRSATYVLVQARERRSWPLT